MVGLDRPSTGTAQLVEWNSALATEKVQRLMREIAQRLEAVIDRPEDPQVRSIDLRQERTLSESEPVSR